MFHVYKGVKMVTIQIERVKGKSVVSLWHGGLLLVRDTIKVFSSVMQADLYACEIAKAFAGVRPTNFRVIDLRK